MSLLRDMPERRFNLLYPIGTPFTYYPNPGIPDGEIVVTDSEAWKTAKGKVVVKVRGRIGAV
ncbi:hypothetical protein I2492_05940 [Budviciaceae bacterium CWB-B4]|uniref:Uncharacterized protein n=1 Tax=Limnobaculum xujianqingii TaxID=2738837 RepID=A0A9D7AH00_9GAMM|nr:hypothetical protein [Limnobaculum xujianqingii]MBK5072549.1 hypothetical protein [Limnobaculum xujianqingii]MBK5175858.1 hypothetical protein [Limnobaculum xujianqingii]